MANFKRKYSINHRLVDKPLNVCSITALMRLYFHDIAGSQLMPYLTNLYGAVVARAGVSQEYTCKRVVITLTNIKQLVHKSTKTMDLSNTFVQFSVFY